MNEEHFKRQLEAYKEGKLSPEEREELERELGKLEWYQHYVEESLDSEESVPSADGRAENMTEALPFNPQKAKRLMKRGKWRARTWSAGSVIGLLLLAMIVNSIIVSIYYNSGTPEKRDLYADVIESAIAVTRPNTTISLSSSPSSLLGIKYFGDFMKQVGDDRVYIGEMDTTLFLAWPRLIQESENKHSSAGDRPSFLPKTENRDESAADWSKLSKLPEGTVAEAFVSFDRLYTTDEALKLFEGKEMEPVWLAVNAGNTDEEHSVYNDSPVGFPAKPMWHYGDGATTVTDEKNFLWRTVQRGTVTSYPSVETYGSGNVRNENFMDTLRLLSEHKAITNYYTAFFDAAEVLQYVEENGVSIYGMVVTGPTKELLKLKDEAFVSRINVGEVALWNWNERNTR